jgi:hypothetical protein
VRDSPIIPNGADLNDYRTNGFYRTGADAQSTNIQNLPPEISGVGRAMAFSLLVETHSSVKQTLSTRGNSNQTANWAWIRTSNGTIWTPWQRLVTINDLLMISPHLWVADGSEIVFTDGSFGRRFAGAISTPASSDFGVTLFNDSSAKFIAGGGWYELGDGSSDDLIGNAISNTMSDSLRNSAIAKGGNGDVRFRSRSDIQRANAPYDIWVRYTKVV